MRPILTISTVPARFNFSPNFTQAGVINVTFIASDGVLADSEVVAITVNNVNRAPGVGGHWSESRSMKAQSEFQYFGY